MAKQIPQETLEHDVIECIEMNGEPTADEIASEIGANTQMVRRALVRLEQQQQVIKATKYQKRNVRWKLSATPSRMPQWRNTQNELVSAVEFFDNIVKYAKNTGKLPSEPMGMMQTGVACMIIAAYYEAAAQPTQAKLAVTMGRQNLVRASSKIHAQAQVIDRVLQDSRMNPRSAKELIPILLEDPNFKFDLNELFENAQLIQKAESPKP